MFYPRGVAVVEGGSEEGRVGERIFNTAVQDFSRGPVVRVRSADGALTGADIETLKGVDLAVIVAPPRLQARLACACDDAGVRAALLMSPLNRELLPEDMPQGMEQLYERCDKGLRVLGPQSFGLMSPHYDLNVTPGLGMALPGSIAFVSQSSAMCSAVLDWSFRMGVGFSAMVACDTMPDLSWPDLIIHFGDDPHTKSIVLCLESVGDSRAFLSAAREIALNKPIILLKTRRQSDALGGDDAAKDDPRPNSIFDAALRRVGVLRVGSISELFDMANILARQPLPKGPRLAIVTNSITPALLATDTLLSSGGSLAQLSDETLDELTTGQATAVSGNPVLVQGNAPPREYARALTTVAADKNVDGMLVVFTPQAATEPTATARSIANVPKRSGKPVLASWMGADRVHEGREVLYHHGVPSFVYPDAPARLFSLMWLHAQNLNSIYETPTLLVDETSVDADGAKRMLDDLRRDAVTVLNVEQSAELLRRYGINLQPDAEPPEDAYKLMVGSRVDKMFGPYMVFGIGGRMSAIYEDIALDLPPLTSALAHRMMEQSAVWRVLRPTSDDDEVAKARVGKLQSLLVRLSQMIAQQPAIRRLTINPLLVSGNEVLITNCSVNLQNPSIADDALPRTAIRPYPTQYIWQETVKDQVKVLFRPVRPEDEPLIVEFHKLLSEDTIYRRYFFQHKLSRRTSHERLRRTCFLDFDREIALAAVLKDEDGKDAIAAVGRLARNRAGDSAEVAMVVADPYQSLGIGTTMLRHLVDIGRAEGVATLEGTMLPGNLHMQHLFGKFDFDIHPGEDDTVVAELKL